VERAHYVTASNRYAQLVSPRRASTDYICQFMNAINRPCSVANLDPANDNVPYQDEAAFDVRELVDVDEVMEREQLGPNGGVLWAMEEVETNFDWLEQQLEQCGRVLNDRVLFGIFY
jgi:hypothetical protein